MFSKICRLLKLQRSTSLCGKGLMLSTSTAGSSIMGNLYKCKLLPLKLNRIENIEAKGEIASSFATMFSKIFCSSCIKMRLNERKWLILSTSINLQTVQIGGKGTDRLVITSNQDELFMPVFIHSLIQMSFDILILSNIRQICSRKHLVITMENPLYMNKQVLNKVKIIVAKGQLSQYGHFLLLSQYLKSSLLQRCQKVYHYVYGKGS